MECGRRKFYHWWKEQELGSQGVDMAVIKEPWCIVIPIFFVALCAHRKKYEQEVPSYLFFDARLQEYKVILKEVGFLSPMVNLWWLCDFSTNVIVQLLNHVQHFATTWTAARQLIRLLCPSPSPWVCSISSLLNQRCHSTSSFSSWPQFFPASGAFPMSQHFTSGGQNTEASASASVLPMNIQDRFL